MWIIVKFLTDDTVAAVPKDWLRDGLCPWDSGKMCQKLIKQLGPPNADFEKYAAVQISTFVTDTYEIALRKARQAEDTSNLSSDEDNLNKQRRKTIPNRLYSDFALGESTSTEPPILDMELATLIAESNNIFNLDSISETSHISDESSRATSTTTVNSNGCVPQNLISNENNINKSTVDKNGNGIIEGTIQNKTLALSEGCPNCKNLLEDFRTLKINIEANQKWMAERFNYISTKMEEVFTLISLNNNATCDDFDDQFPIKSLPDMESFENKLKNLEFKQKILKHLRRVGGSSVEDSTRRLWKYLLSVELQYQCNWTGLKKKKALKDTLINGLIESAVQQSFGTATIKMIQCTTKDYIQHASNRLKKDNP